MILGTHVRFRLGGFSFPPSIYFKIYTHRPLCDINSFAPRDYSKERKSDGGLVPSNMMKDVSGGKGDRSGIIFSSSFIGDCWSTS